MSKTSWDLDDGLKLVRALQEESMKFGYHVALGGSVLHKGHSERDIDLFFFPASGETNAPAREDLSDWLEKLWGRGRQLGYYDMIGNGAADLNDYGDRNRIFPPQPRYQVQAPPIIRNMNDAPPQVNRGAEVRGLMDNNGFYVEPEDGDDLQEVQPRQVFNHRLTFKRVGGDKIDVFII